jgi:glutathione S-transferase
MRVLPEAADGLKATARDNLEWLDGLLAGKQWIAGDRFTVADIILYCALDFGRGVGQQFDPSLKNVAEHGSSASAGGRRRRRACTRCRKPSARRADRSNGAFYRFAQ